MEHLVRISKVKNIPNFPLKPSTLYKWRTLRKHKDLFVNLGGAVFVDMNRLARLMEASRGVDA